MSTQGNYLTIALGPSDQDLQDALYKAVDVSGTVAATSAAALGILQTKVPSGYNFTLSYIGQMKGYAAGAINSGTPVGITTSGFLAATTAGSAQVGRTVYQAASGDLVEILANFI